MTFILGLIIGAILWVLGTVGMALYRKHKMKKKGVIE